MTKKTLPFTKEKINEIIKVYPTPFHIYDGKAIRTALYGAYHHITEMGKENAVHDHTYNVVVSLCENNDKFAINRRLP